MSNKTSDKNVANIEDDVKILNNFCEYEDAVVLTDYALTLVQEAIEHILAEREQKDKRIQELEEKVNNSISIQNVIEAISVHQDYLLNQATTSNPTLDANFRNREKYAIQVLQELLEGGENEKSN